MTDLCKAKFGCKNLLPEGSSSIPGLCSSCERAFWNMVGGAMRLGYDVAFSKWGQFPQELLDQNIMPNDPIIL